jgi:hypothetical protein
MGTALHEVKFEEPQPGQPHHRWFQSDYFDVYLWYDEEGALCRLQLCYDRYGDEHAFTWEREVNRLIHNAVGGGERFFGHGNTALLETAKRLPPDLLVDRFRAASESLTEAVREPILRVIANVSAS